MTCSTLKIIAIFTLCITTQCLCSVHMYVQGRSQKYWFSQVYTCLSIYFWYIYYLYNIHYLTYTQFCKGHTVKTIEIKVPGWCLPVGLALILKCSGNEGDMRTGSILLYIRIAFTNANELLLWVRQISFFANYRCNSCFTYTLKNKWYC